MEQDASWEACQQFQLANWAIQEPAAEAWSSAAGSLPVEYVSVDMIGNYCNSEAYLPESCEGHGQELAEYYSYYTAASQTNWPLAELIDGQNMQVMEISSKQQFAGLQNEKTRISIDSDDVGSVFEQVAQEFRDDIDLIKQKMHRYPASLRDHINLHESYTVPRIVAIGPYHHHLPHLKQAEKVKHMAAIQCIQETGRQAEEVYGAVANVADNYACRLYDKDVMAGISKVDFRDMMFVDACFFVQYMLMECEIGIDASLLGFLGANGRDINRDLILLENQLPWKVVETVLEFMPKTVPMNKFISGWKGYLQHHRIQKQDDIAYQSRLVEEERYKPHLLGLLRHYTVGRNTYDKEKDKENNKNKNKNKNKPERKRRAISISAIELAEIGISLRPNKTMELIDMNLNQEGTLLAELSLAPLSLDRNRASFLFNMAALELCTFKSFSKEPENSAVCSYLLLLALLVSKEDDVRELRARGLLQGGGGLTDEEAFKFFSTFQGLRFGKCYNRVLSQIEDYKEGKWMEAKLYTFYYKNKKTIAAVVTGVGALVGIIGTLVSIKTSI